MNISATSGPITFKFELKHHLGRRKAALTFRQDRIKTGYFTDYLVCKVAEMPTKTLNLSRMASFRVFLRMCDAIFPGNIHYGKTNNLRYELHLTVLYI